MVRKGCLVERERDRGEESRCNSLQYVAKFKNCDRSAKVDADAWQTMTASDLLAQRRRRRKRVVEDVDCGLSEMRESEGMDRHWQLV